MMILFSLLPDDLIIYILSEWIASYREVSAMDIELANVFLRQRYLQWMKRTSYIHNPSIICSSKLLNNWKFKKFCDSRFTNPISSCEINCFYRDSYFDQGLVNSLESFAEHYSAACVKTVTIRKSVGNKNENLLKQIVDTFPTIEKVSLSLDGLCLPEYYLQSPPSYLPCLKLTSFTLQKCLVWEEVVLDLLKSMEHSPTKHSLQSITVYSNSRRRDGALYIKSTILYHVIHMFPNLASLSFHACDVFRCPGDGFYDALSSSFLDSLLQQENTSLRHFEYTILPLYEPVCIATLRQCSEGYEKILIDLIPLLQSFHRVEELTFTNLSFLSSNHNRNTPDLYTLFIQFIPTAWTCLRVLVLDNTLFIDSTFYQVIFETCGHCLEKFTLSENPLGLSSTDRFPSFDIVCCDSIAMKCKVLRRLSLTKVSGLTNECIEALCLGSFPLEECSIINCLEISSKDVINALRKRFSLKLFRFVIKDNPWGNLY
jgi:hypothetical protein